MVAVGGGKVQDSQVRELEVSMHSDVSLQEPRARKSAQSRVLEPVSRKDESVRLHCGLEILQTRPSAVGFLILG